MKLDSTAFLPFPAWRCSKGCCGRSRHSQGGSWHHSYCNNHRHHQTSGYMDSQSCFFLWLHGQLTHRNTYVTIFLSKKYWSFFAPMTRRRETSSLSIWRERDLSVVKSRITHVAELAGYVTVLPGCMITVSHPVKNKIWIASAVETSGFHHQNNEHSVYWRQSDYNQWSAVISNLEGTVQYEVNNIKQA